MIEALIAGERDPRRLADLARGRMKTKRSALIAALDGRFDDHHAELARMLLDQIDTLTAQITTLTTRIDHLLGQPNQATQTLTRARPARLRRLRPNRPRSNASVKSPASAGLGLRSRPAARTEGPVPSASVGPPGGAHHLADRLLVSEPAHVVRPCKSRFRNHDRPVRADPAPRVLHSHQSWQTRCGGEECGLAYTARPHATPAATLMPRRAGEGPLGPESRIWRINGRSASTLNCEF